jgi:hypothetical protein
MFNIKTLVAVAALAVAGTASAKVLDPIATVNGGEVSLTLWSPTAEVSYIFDTGLMLADFRAQAGVAGYKYEVDLGADAEYQNFLTKVGSASDVQFAFFGGDNSGNQAANRTLITTLATTSDVTAVTNGNMVNSLNQIYANYLSVVNLDSRIQAAPNASATFQKGTGGNAYIGEILGEDFGGQFQKVTGDKGTSLALYDFVRSSTSIGGDAIESSLGSPAVTATYAGNTFTVTAAVPEPESYALMLAGLAVAGTLAARRRAR